MLNTEFLPSRHDHSHDTISPIFRNIYTVSLVTLRTVYCQNLIASKNHMFCANPNLGHKNSDGKSYYNPVS